MCEETFLVSKSNHKFCKKCQEIPNVVQNCWVKKNPDRVKLIQSKYRERNLKLCRERTRRNQVTLNNKKRFSGNRVRVLERDKYECQICQKDVTGKNMSVVHHRDEDKSNNTMSNLQTLCKSCHPRHHYKLHRFQFKS